ncbi:beta-ketoacyl synthase N-terminal-like domain-containing protein [Cronbergia sp. UHCC 0137]|uniref:type I polyketide synthase n=1 Tax=Cronbergia sp. UHCC 0137 TaxID=3110239 RepID=UPI002B201CF4|nr:polyketide synthase [Cronbergia sp. UHCC 0137]MEA5617535.1 beta-ketoacyl synthase N-terminal-like domain-containing protein [Cronbergia sp. UHCC 0137]
MNYSVDDITNYPASQRILAALKEARIKLEAVELEKSEQVAIVGMAGRFPGAGNVDEFWHNLKNGISSIEFLSDEELLENGVKLEDLKKPNYVRAYASLSGIDEFDAAFFGYSPREAEILDPQHRLFLECAWEALENAGYDSEQYSGNIAVYGGAALNSYLVNLSSNSHYRDSADTVQVVISNVMGLMPTRVSYKLNLTGASCGIQTGCSTSLVSVHIACQSLLNKECDMALAGGVSIGSGEKTGYLYQEDGVLSPDGYCRAFDVNAKGTVFGNGVGIVVLKRLRDAIQEGDHIYAIIKGTAINNDGSQKVGLTAPSVTGQSKAITTALAKAKINPETIQYIETHGTGTALGDPIEIAALTKAFSPHTNQKQFCAIGSVKTNIGHLDAAAGISGLIKTALAIKHKQIPPSLNFTTANPQIDFANSPFFVNTQLTPWINHQHPRRAGVSSFGMGGTNAHVILEEAPTPLSQNTSRPWHLLTLSAKTPSALETATKNLAEYFQNSPDVNIADVAYTLQIGRRGFSHRRCLVCQTPAQAIEILSGIDASQLLSYSPENSELSLVFMFPGQGSQYVNMGQELYNTEPVFRKEIDHCSEILQSHLGLDLRSILFKQDNENLPSPPIPNYELRITNYELLTQTTYAQPALFVVEYALAKLWLSYGIQPQAMIGHSIGEYVAATLAGVFTLADALAIVAQRAELMQQCPSGVMLSVSLAPEKLQQFLTDDLVIAVHNAPQLCVVSGTEAAITLLEEVLIHQNIAHRRLHTSHAFHSPLMVDAIAPLTQILQKITLQPPQIPFISNVTGTWITPEQATNPNYWATHLRQPVLFAEGITQLQQTPNQIFVEVGFGQTLSTIIRQFPDAPLTLSSGKHPQDSQSDVALICKTLGQLWLRGVTINWLEFYTQQQRRRLPLPTYPFERQRYWVERDTLPKTTSNPSKTLQKQEEISNWFYLPSWRQKPLLRSPAPLNKQRYLVFCHAGNVGETLVHHLQQSGQEVVTVKPGTGFIKEVDNYRIAPENPEDYKTLWLQLQTDDKLPDVIIHSWTLQESTDFQQQQNLGFYSLLWLTQALSSSTLSIYVLTQQVQNVLGNETINLNNATILGLMKVIPQEYPNLTCQHIDVAISHINFQQIVREIITNPLEKAVAYRGKTRWIQEFQPISLPEPTQLPLITGGVYVIAGDLVEGLGLIYAKFLSTTVNAKLVFLGRADLPQPTEWDNWLATHGRQDAVSYCIQQLQGLQAQGCEFLFTTVDLADMKQVEEAIAHSLTQFGTINGVIHAGAMGDRASCLIRNLTIPQCEKQFHTKIHGLLALETALQNQHLDFFLLQSSLSAVVGGIGFAAYAGANCFMDAISHQRNQNSHTPWISINWDAVSLAEITTPTGAALVDLSMTPPEVWQVTQRILAQPIAPQITVSPVDLASRQQSQLPEQSTANYVRPQITATYIPPSNEIEVRVTQVMENLLGISPIGIHDNFFELGGHSLLAIQAVSQLREEFQVELPMRQFLFESPTIAGIAKIIIENQSSVTDDTAGLAALIDQIEKMTPTQVQQLLDPDFS